MEKKHIMNFGSNMSLKNVQRIISIKKEVPNLEFWDLLSVLLKKIRIKQTQYQTNRNTDKSRPTMQRYSTCSTKFELLCSRLLPEYLKCT